jgi:hypothetical protein
MCWCFSFIPTILISLLIIALFLALIIWFNIFFMIILIKTLCGWSSIIWGRGSLESCGLKSPIAILYKASQGASSSSTISGSYCSTWEPLVLSNIVSHMVSTQPESLLKIQYTREFESYLSKNPSYTLGTNLEDLDLFRRTYHLLSKTLK